MKIRRLSDNEFFATVVEPVTEPMSVGQVVFSLVMLAALLVFLLFWALLWAGLAVERMLLVSLGVAGTATGLLFVGEALMPRWQRAWWKPPPGGRATVRLGRLSSLGVGIWFGAGGVAFLGYGWLTEHIVPAILGASATGFALIMVGMRYDRRGAESGRAAVRRPGWLMASRGDDDAQRCRDAREELCRSIQGHLVGRTTLERVDLRHKDPVSLAGDPGFPTGWPGAAEQWRAFRSAFAAGDEIWTFNTAAVRLGRASGEEGFARLRDGIVADWFISGVVG